MKRIYAILFLGMACAGTVKTQDIHYSQFFNSPLNLNPALTGMFAGDYRFAANLRTQWGSVTIPYNTFSLSADAQNPFGKIHNVGGGFMINHDQAGDSHFRTFQMNFTGSYIKPLDKDSTLILSGGLSVGVSIRSLDYDPLRFDVQYDGYQYNSGLPTNETFNRDSRVYPNFNIGGSILKNRGGRQYILGGISFSNIQKPKQSYFNTDNITLDRKMNIHGEGAVTLSDKWDVIPSINIQFQGKYAEIVPGGMGRYVLKDEKGIYRAVTAGGWYRFKDAFYLMGGFEMDKMKAGISYDINFSDLVPASNNRGAFELSLIYIIDTYNPKRIMHRICPNDL
ncbi:MAG TPA: PorP/SprF family type IX secretion system membrane protein [Flavobacteriales bacterium]|nr:PorP/SprF family type IX secretion system membrane protein [Flavobacteriales bacterium]